MKIKWLIIILIVLSSCAHRKDKVPENVCSEMVQETNNLAEYKNCTEIFNWPQKYDSACDCIEEHALTFPTDNVESAILFKNCLSEPSDRFQYVDSFFLDKQFILDFRKIAGDSTNFIWGEPGTPYTDYIVLFYDAEGNAINKVEISYDNCLSAVPHLGTMKWGGLSNKGMNLINTLINRYNKSPIK